MLKVAFFTADPDADLDGNGIVNFLDLAVMKQSFFQPPGPSGVAAERTRDHCPRCADLT